MNQQLAQIMASPLFSGMNETNIKKVLNCLQGKIRTYDKGEIIFLTNEELRYIGVLLDGCVHMVKENSQGDKILLSIFRKGDIFGESFVCGGEQLAYTTFQTEEKTTVLFLPLQKAVKACTAPCPFHGRLFENMITLIANKNVRLMEKIDVSSQKTLREKILAYLRLEIQHKGRNPVELDISRTVLAEYLGVNRSALTRELSQMRAEGILEFDRNRFYLTGK